MDRRAGPVPAHRRAAGRRDVGEPDHRRCLPLARRPPRTGRDRRMKELVLLVVMAAVVSGITWWLRRRRPDIDSEARRSRLVGATSPWRSVIELARVEARLLHLHPATLIGLLLLLPLGLLLGVGSTDRVDFGTNDVDTVLVCALFAWPMLVASACAVLRSRRYHTDELVATMPMSTASRTEAHLLAAASLALIGAFATGAVFAIAATRSFGTPRWSVVALGPALIVGAAVLGVAVARWIPSVGAAVAAVVATILVQTNFHHQSPQWRWLHFLVYSDVANHYRELEMRHDEWHLVFVIAAIGVPVVVALFRSGWTRRVAVVLGVSALVFGISGFAQVRTPGAGSVAAAALRLEDSVQAQSCATSGVVPTCVWPRLEHGRPALLAVVAGVAPAAPPA